VKILERLVWKLHATAMDERNASPSLIMVTKHADHNHLESVHIDDDTWDQHDPASIIDALSINEAHAPAAGNVLGVLFSGEAWLVETNNKPPAEVDRLMRQATGRRLYREPDRISIRTTVGVGPDEEFYQLIQRHDQNFVTDVVAEAVAAEETEYVMQQLRSSAIPAALRHLLARVEAHLEP
jgi:hypothetical protein